MHFYQSGKLFAKT